MKSMKERKNSMNATIQEKNTTIDMTVVKITMINMTEAKSTISMREAKNMMINTMEGKDTKKNMMEAKNTKKRSQFEKIGSREKNTTTDTMKNMMKRNPMKLGMKINQMKTFRLELKRNPKTDIKYCKVIKFKIQSKILTFF